MKLLYKYKYKYKYIYYNLFTYNHKRMIYTASMNWLKLIRLIKALIHINTCEVNNDNQ